MVDLDCLNIAFAAIQHAGHFARVTQTAARTRSLRVSFACYYFHLNS